MAERQWRSGGNPGKFVERPLKQVTEGDGMHEDNQSDHGDDEPRDRGAERVGEGGGEGGGANGSGSERARDPVPEKRFRTEAPDDPLAAVARDRNRLDIRVAEMCAPDPGADVEHHLAGVGARLGLGKGQSLKYCDIGTMLSRMPVFKAEAETRGHVPFFHLWVIARDTAAVADEYIPAVEQALLALFDPAKDRQALPGVVRVGNVLRKLIGELEPEVTPPDDDEPVSDRTRGELVDIHNSGTNGLGELHVMLATDRMAEFEARLTAIRDHERAKGEKCTWADAFMHMVHGTGDAKVVINVYRSADGGPAWLDGAGWLDGVATEEWCARASHIRWSGDSSVAGYAPTEAQKARVRGRDGTCRFPGCEVPAHKCDIDHIQPYDHADSAGGGPTDTGNLHCLCRTHHNLKTSRLWDVTTHADCSETWTSRDGETTATTVPTGPMAGFGRQTFDQRATRTAETLREYNRKRMARDAEAAEVAADVDELRRRERQAAEEAEHAAVHAEYERAVAAYEEERRDHAEYMAAWNAAEDDGWGGAAAGSDEPRDWSARGSASRSELLRPKSVHRRKRINRSAEQAPRPPQAPPPIPGIPF